MKTNLNFFILSLLFIFGLPGPVFSVSFSSDPAPNYWDFGDNPDSYRTTLGQDGARHLDGTLEWLGYRAPDYEDDGQPSPLSDQDDLNSVDDEDGVVFIGTVDPVTGAVIDSDRYWGGLYGSVEITLSVEDWNSGRYGADDLLYIDGWFDWNHDGDYDDSGFIDYGPYAGMSWNEHSISFTTDPSLWLQDTMTFEITFLNGWGPLGEIYARFRVNYDEGVNPSYGEMTYGEVEDYGPIPDKDQAPIPEPATLLLFGMGGLELLKRSRHIKRLRKNS